MLRPTVFLAFLAAVPPSVAVAQEPPRWYIGADLSRVDDRFQPHYTVVADGEPSQFDNRAHGLGSDLFVGRQYFLGKMFSIGGQATVGTNRTQWSLSIPSEPADFNYRLPYRVVVTVVPEVHVKPRLSIFGDLGGGVGVVREMKVSASLTPSTYEVDEWRTLMSVGLGVRVKLSEGYDLFALQRWLRYDAIEYDTFNRGGTFLEHVVDEPRSRSLAIGLRTTY